MNDEFNENYINLACAVIQKAVEDYRVFVMGVRYNGKVPTKSFTSNSIPTWVCTPEALEKFFEESEWFKFFSRIEGKDLLKEIKKEGYGFTRKEI